MAAKYSACNNDTVIQILENYSIIEDKKTDAYNIEKEKKAWEKIALEYNGTATGKRTVVQLKRLWDKMKRSRKDELAEERRELMATGGGPSKPSPSLQPGIDSLLQYLNYEIDIVDDSDGININRNARDLSVSNALPEVILGTEDRSTQQGPSSVLGRLSLLEMECQHWEEFDKVRMEKANYRKEAARLVMLQEEAKF